MRHELHLVYPVYNSNYDDIVGVVNLKNIFANIDDDDFNSSDLMTEAHMMEQTTAYKALSVLRRQVFIMLW
jgi:putative hemolysin